MEKAQDNAKDATADKSAAPAQKPPKRWKKILLWILLILLGLTLFIAVLILGTPRRWQVDPKISKEEARQIRQIMNRLTAVMVTPEGTMAQKAEIEFTESELNTMLRTGLRTAQLHKTPDLYYDAEWKDGSLRLRISRVLPLLALNLETDLVPEFADGRPVIRTRSCALGWLPILSGGVDAALRAVFEHYEDTPEWQAAVSMVESVEVTGRGTVRVVFYPDQISKSLSVLMNAAWQR
ncbi:MAG: hypothetical protein J5806_15040 [Lentisphaeria bacterium]|nr:hypothetical protein [Lentisphaeria bacterium]